jgi:SAM-dependent methyltransferase
MGPGDRPRERQDRLTIVTSSNQTPLLRPPSTEGAANSQPGGSTRPIERMAPERILELSYAFWRSKALLSAVELGVFTTLAGNPLDLATLTRRTGIHERGARDFFDALVALGALWRDADGRYGNQPEFDLYLDRRKPTYLGCLLEHLNARHYQNWGLLTQALRTGASPKGGVGTYKALHNDHAMQEIFLNGMTAGSLVAAQAIAAKFPWREFRTMIDVGTAQGGAAVEIACAHPHLTGGGFDLPAVEPVFASYILQHGLSDRLKFHSGDFFSDPLPTADVLVMGRILHNWDLATKTILLGKAYRALPPGGALIVYDPLIDDDRRVDAHALLSSLNMLIETAGGFEYTFADCKMWMSHAGFIDIRAEPLGDMHTAVFARKPS